MIFPLLFFVILLLFVMSISFYFIDLKYIQIDKKTLIKRNIMVLLAFVLFTGIYGVLLWLSGGILMQLLVTGPFIFVFSLFRSGARSIPNIIGFIVVALNFYFTTWCWFSKNKLIRIAAIVLFMLWHVAIAICLNLMQKAG